MAYSGPTISTGNLQSIAQSFGYLNVRQSPYNATGDGVTDDTTAIQTALNDAYTTNRPVLVPDGSYLITSTLTFIPSGGTIYNTAPTIIGQGSGTTIFLNRVANGPCFKFDVAAASGAYNVLRGGPKISGIQIQGNGGNVPNSDGLYFRRAYFINLNDVYIVAHSGVGIVFYNGDLVSGDNDCCQFITMDNVFIKQCNKWGLQIQNPLGGLPYNQTGYFNIGTMWITQCGVVMGTGAASGTGGGTGHVYFNSTTPANTIRPTSGGAYIKCQQFNAVNLTFSECPNVALYIPNDRYGQGKRFSVTNLDCENNQYAVWISACQHFEVNYLRCHVNSVYTAYGGVVIDATSGLVDFCKISSSDLLADNAANGLCPNFIAFDGVGTQNAVKLQVENVYWTIAPTGSQQTYNANLLTMRGRPNLVEDSRVDIAQYGRQWNANTLARFNYFQTGPSVLANAPLSLAPITDRDWMTRVQIQNYSALSGAATYTFNLIAGINRSNTDGIRWRFEVWHQYVTTGGNSLTIVVNNTGTNFVMPTSAFPTLTYKQMAYMTWTWCEPAQTHIPDSNTWTVVTLP